MKYCVYDIEYTASYFEVGFYNGSKFVIMELLKPNDRIKPEQITMLRSIFSNYTLVGFNNQKFDNPILQGFYQGLTANDLYRMGSKIISENENRWWISNPSYDNRLFLSIDIMNSCPGKISLKNAGARMCSETLMDNPVDFDSEHILSIEEREKYIKYNKNDLLITWDLFKTLETSVALKEMIGKEIGKDCKSKGEPKIAEMYLGKSYRNAGVPKKVSYKIDYKLKTNIANYVRTLFERNYIVNEAGYPINEDKWPEIKIADRYYAVGLGGLHSIHPEPEKYSNVTDIDVVSYYPSLLVNFEWDKKFESTYYERLEAKKNKDKLKSDMLKLVLNSSFGKLADKWSGLYDPAMMLKVTLTGQLLLIELISRLTFDGAKVVYANTDGIVVEGSYNKDIVSEWEKEYSLQMEEEKFDKLFIRDVNNLFAIKDNEIVKRKGVFAGSSLRKGYEHPLVYENAMSILNGKEPASLIENKKGLLITRGSKSWCEWNGQILGKVVRWIWVKDGQSIFNSVGQVANSDNCFPIMSLSDLDDCPDIDYDRYEKEIKSLVQMFA